MRREREKRGDNPLGKSLGRHRKFAGTSSHSPPPPTLRHCNLPANLISRCACTNLQEFRAVLPLSRLFSVWPELSLLRSPLSHFLSLPPRPTLSLAPSLSLSFSDSLHFVAAEVDIRQERISRVHAQCECTTRPIENPFVSFAASVFSPSLPPPSPPGSALRFFPPRRIRGVKDRRQMVFRAVADGRSHNWSCNTCYRRWPSFPRGEKKMEE